MESTVRTIPNSTEPSVWKNFVIPKKRRSGLTGFVEPCPKDSREYLSALTILSDSRLNQDKDIFMNWECQQVNLVNNENLSRLFSKKRSEMRSKGRHLRDMEEKFCFLGVSSKVAEQICHEGLRTGIADRVTLGDPSHGVYLYRHVDVALRNTLHQNIVIFKVIFGKVKRVPSSLGKQSSLDPTIHYDCYISKDPPRPNDTCSRQAMGSLVFLFDYNEHQELNHQPRQCLPYAVVLLAPISSAFSAVSASTQLSSLKIPFTDISPGFRNPLKKCPVDERRDKERNATLKFRHSGAPEHSVNSNGYSSGQCADATSFQRVGQADIYSIPSHSASLNGQVYEHQAFDRYTPQQSASSSYSTAPHTASLPFTDRNVPLGGQMFLLPFSSTATAQDIQGILPSESSVQNYIYKNHQYPYHYLYQYQCLYQYQYPYTGHYPYLQSTAAVSLANVSTTVFSSQSLRDPRLCRQGGINVNETFQNIEDTQRETCQMLTNSDIDVTRKHDDTLSNVLNREISANGSESYVSDLSENSQVYIHGSFDSVSPSLLVPHENKQSCFVSLSGKESQENINYLVVKDMERAEMVMAEEKGPLTEKEQPTCFNVYDTNMQNYKESFVEQVDPMSSPGWCNEACYKPELKASPHTPAQTMFLKNYADSSSNEKAHGRIIQPLPHTAEVLDQSNHSKEETSLMPKVSNSKHSYGSSEDTNAKSHSEYFTSLCEAEEADEGTKKNESRSKEGTAKETNEIKQGVVMVALTQTQNLSSQDKLKSCTDNQNSIEVLEEEHSEMQGTSEQYHDLSPTQTEGGRDGILNEQSMVLKLANSSVNAVNENAVSTAQLISPKINHSPLGYNPFESHESISGCTKCSEVILASESEANGQPQLMCLLTKMDPSEEFLLPEELSTQDVRDIHTMEASQTARITNPDIDLKIMNSDSEGDQNTSLCSGGPKHEEIKTEASQNNISRDTVIRSAEKSQNGEHEPQTSDTLLCVLYRRMQFFSEFFTSSAIEDNPVSDKPYLKPRPSEHNTDNLFSPVQNRNQANKKYNMRITVKSDRTVISFSKQKVLSENFPFNRGQRMHKRNFNNNTNAARAKSCENNRCLQFKGKAASKNSKLRKVDGFIKTRNPRELSSKGTTNQWLKTKRKWILYSPRKIQSMYKRKVSKSQASTVRGVSYLQRNQFKSLFSNSTMPERKNKETNQPIHSTVSLNDTAVDHSTAASATNHNKIPKDSFKERNEPHVDSILTQSTTGYSAAFDADEVRTECGHVYTIGSKQNIDSHLSSSNLSSDPVGSKCSVNSNKTLEGHSVIANGNISTEQERKDNGFYDSFKQLPKQFGNKSRLLMATNEMKNCATALSNNTMLSTESQVEIEQDFQNAKDNSSCLQESNSDTSLKTGFISKLRNYLNAAKSANK